jgi:SAM-dependent methyltransferase
MMEMNMEIEEVNCPICEKSEESFSIQKVPFKWSGVPHVSLSFSIQGRPVIPYFVSIKRFPEEESSVESWERMMKAVFRRAANLLQQYRRDGRILDVGTGFGFFLSEMNKRGWDVTGVEISKKAMDYAKDVLGLTIHPGPLEEVSFPDNHFDVITGFYVIEHLPNPIGFLQECYRILKPGGFLLLRYPHTTPIKNLLHFFGVKNRLYDLPAHLSDFSPKMIQRCLEGIGLKMPTQSVVHTSINLERLASIFEVFRALLSRLKFLLRESIVFAFKDLADHGRPMKKRVVVWVWGGQRWE